MYVLYVNGAIVDQFNPVPDYWSEDISEEEIASWKGNAAIVSQYVKGIKPAAITKYLVRWDEEMEGEKKAYTNDEFTYEDWQLLDFMKKLGLPYPLDDDGNPKGQTYKFWTKDLPLISNAYNEDRHALSTAAKTKKPWWKLW